MTKPPQRKPRRNRPRAGSETPKLSSDEVWNLIKPRIDEYWRFGKFFLVITAGIVGLLFTGFSGLVVALLKTEKFRDELVTSVVSLDTLLKGRDDDFFGHIDKYFLAQNPLKAFDNPKIDPLKLKAAGFLQDSFIKSGVVSYAFSTSFELKDGPGKTRKIRFLKPEGSRALVECYATYSDPTARKIVYVVMNDYQQVGEITPRSEDAFQPDLPAGVQGIGRVPLEKSNAKYFLDKTKEGPSQSMAFNVDDKAAFSGTIYIDCVVTVSVHASLVQKPEG
jgi:hypothetical protein